MHQSIKENGSEDVPSSCGIHFIDRQSRELHWLTIDEEHATHSACRDRQQRCHRCVAARDVPISQDIVDAEDDG